MDADRLTPQTSPDADTLVVPTAEEEERLRDLIQAELDRQHARPVARQTLALLAEAAVEAIDAAPHYRVVDRRGAVRLHPATETEEARPLDLSDLVGELRERHPELFAPPPPPEPEPPPEPPHDALADMKAAGARFVETQSALARSFATHSAERGRALASAATGRIEGWRSRLERRLDARAAAAPVGDESAVPKSRFGAWPARGLAGVSAVREHGARLSERGRDRVNQGLDFARSGLSFPDDGDGDGDGADRRRAITFGLAGLAALAVIAAFVIPGQDETPAPAQQTAQAPRTTPPTSEATPAPEEETPAPVETKPAEETPRNPNEVVGVPEVIDTATLRVSGKLLHLFGVEWVRGGQADELTKYLAGRSVRCLPAAGSSAFTCTVEGRDVSEVVLFNGGGRASAEASTELVAAEDHARTERLGVWKR